jgi:hypothetical protein
MAVANSFSGIVGCSVTLFRCTDQSLVGEYAEQVTAATACAESKDATQGMLRFIAYARLWKISLVARTGVEAQHEKRKWG